MKKISPLLACVIIIGLVVGATTAYTFYKNGTLIDIKGWVEPTELNIETLPLDLSGLKPGETITFYEVGKIDISTNALGIKASIFVDEFDWEAINKFSVSGEVVDRDTGAIITIFENRDIRYNNIEIPSIPMNTSFHFNKVEIKAGYPEKKESLEDMDISVRIQSQPEIYPADGAKG